MSDLLENKDMTDGDWESTDPYVETHGLATVMWQTQVTQYPRGTAPIWKFWWARLFGKRVRFLTPTSCLLTTYQVGNNRYEWKLEKPENVAAGFNGASDFVTIKEVLEEAAIMNVCNAIQIDTSGGGFSFQATQPQGVFIVGPEVTDKLEANGWIARHTTDMYTVYSLTDEGAKVLDGMRRRRR